MMNHESYLKIPIMNPNGLIEIVRDHLRGDSRYDLGHVDAFVGTGLSGTMAVPLVAHALGKRMAIIRKEDDNTSNNHSCNRVEGNMEGGDRWVFLDDLIASGATFARVHATVERYGDGMFEFAGASLYHDGFAYAANHNMIQSYLSRHVGMYS